MTWFTSSARVMCGPPPNNTGRSTSLQITRTTNVDTHIDSGPGNLGSRTSHSCTYQIATRKSSHVVTSLDNPLQLVARHRRRVTEGIFLRIPCVRRECITSSPSCAPRIHLIRAAAASCGTVGPFVERRSENWYFRYCTRRISRSRK